MGLLQSLLKHTKLRIMQWCYLA